MHLELRETVARVGADIKQKIMQTLKTTIDTVYNYTSLHKNPNDTKAITMEVDKVCTAYCAAGIVSVNRLNHFRYVKPFLLAGH